MYSSEVGPLPADQEAAALLATSQVTGVLQAVRSLASGLLRDPQAAHLFHVRHELDIATGIVLMRDGCTEAQTRSRLAEQAAAQGVTVQDLVRRVIDSAGSGSGPSR